MFYEYNMSFTAKRRTNKYMSHILRTNGLLKHVIEERIEGTGRRKKKDVRATR